jgi:hypothetical protein
VAEAQPVVRLARRKAARFGIGPVAVNGVEMSGGGR